MSGLCPFARHLIIPPGDNDPRIRPRLAILHVDAGNAESLHDYFRDRSGGVESHFHVRRDGVLEQYRGIYDQADANNLANDFAVSIETQGFGAGEWTAEQLATIKRLLLWLNAEAGIPLAKCRKWDGSGVGYHVQFGAPGPWTPVAKSCPGPDRVRQYNDVLVPWLNTNPQEDDMAQYAEQLDEILAVVKGTDAVVRAKLTRTNARVERVNTKLARLIAQGKATRADLEDLAADLTESEEA